MFDISSEDINQLNDIDLRELVGRLCEAELESRGLSTAAVTWGGNQTASDGGLDVRVELPPGVSIDGFIPRGSSGFQVKKPDMPRSQIISEMRPTGVIRPVIQELADEAGAYIIISSTGSTADSALGNRRQALREALYDVGNAKQLHTDFYDRSRLATWVRCYPGLIALVKEKIGRLFSGWRPYAAWSGAIEGKGYDYLLDEKMRLHFGRRNDTSVHSMEHAIDKLRDELSQPGKIIRLVGLSGVGKTRLAQVLFDASIGRRPLPKSLAVYTNLSDAPDPMPTGMASDLIANRMRAVLIVDNCPSELHHRLSEVCRDLNSTISVLTIEYDIRDDQPEGTSVYTLESSSVELIFKLISRRYLHLSQVDARTISEMSGGNARIAIALAETVRRTDTIGGLTNEQLFERLFHQRQEQNDGLLLAAQACSLVYSFQGDMLGADEAEYSMLAVLVGQTPAEIYRYIGELLRRDLMQKRGVWRAVLPHAIANRLASRALEDIPLDLINQQLVDGGNDRLARSFSRRLSYLLEHPKAEAIVKKWLLHDGLLGDVVTLSDLRHDMFENVASVLPWAALTALERAGNHGVEVAAEVWRRYHYLLRSLAYDPLLFERCTNLLVQAARQHKDNKDAEDTSRTFASLFTINLSGTHASLEQRLDVIEQLIKSSDDRDKALGLSALEQLLEATQFSSDYYFSFGVRSRDYGYTPRDPKDVTRWFSCALFLVKRLALANLELKEKLGDILSRKLRGLWTVDPIQEELGALFRWFAEDGFWLEGWAACREAIYFDKEQMTSHAAMLLVTLKDDLKPISLLAQVKTVVLGGKFGDFDFDGVSDIDDYMVSISRLEAESRLLGIAVISDDLVLEELIPDLICGGSRVFSFGRGLASATLDHKKIWGKLIRGYEAIDRLQRDAKVLCGFLVELSGYDTDIVDQLIKDLSENKKLLEFLPELYIAIGLDHRAVDKLKQVLNEGYVPVSKYLALAYGGATNTLVGEVLKELIVPIADYPEGFDVALEIFAMRLFSDRSSLHEHDPKILEVGVELIQRIKFKKFNSEVRDRHLSEVVKACLSASESYSLVVEVVGKLLKAVVEHETYVFSNDKLFLALLKLQPSAVLDTLFLDEELQSLVVNSFFGRMGLRGRIPTDIISCDEIIAWCEVEGERRYPLMASIITFECHSEPFGTLEWSAQAKSILCNAPDVRRVLEEIIKRFKPNSWSGSRATIMENSVQLLGKLDSLVVPDVMQFVVGFRRELLQEVARLRQRETEIDSAIDESFE